LAQIDGAKVLIKKQQQQNNTLQEQHQNCRFALLDNIHYKPQRLL